MRQNWYAIRLYDKTLQNYYEWWKKILNYVFFFFFLFKTFAGKKRENQLFFRYLQDWWNDFDLPMQSYQKTFNRQISETPRRSMLDSFFDLKMGRQGRDSFLTSGTSHSSSMKLKEGVYTIGNYVAIF